MTPQQQGRHCHACQKTVVDFTRMDDQEVLNWLARHREPLCGRFCQDELQRPLLAEPKSRQSKGRYWHYLIALLLFTTEIKAQAQPPKRSTH